MMTRKKGFMDRDLFRKIIEELRPYLYSANLYFQGEPMLHPEFFSIIAFAGGIKTTIATNGHFLNAENCDKLAGSRLSRLIISLDGIDQQTYSTYRVNGDFRKVKEGIITLSNAVKKHDSSLKIIIQVLVNRFNEEQIPELRKFAGENDAKFVLKSMQIYHEKKQWLPASESFRRYELKDGSYSNKGKMPEMCPRLWFNPVITWDGKVVPCCFDKDAQYIMGDLNTESFSSIWNGERYHEFRTKLLKSRKQIDICRNCTSGLTGVNV